MVPVRRPIGFRRLAPLGLALGLGAGCAAPVVRAQSVEPPAGPPPTPVNGSLVKNGSFEEDWFHHAFAQNRRFLLLHATDMGMGEADGRVDYWDLFKSDPIACWDTTAARTGERSLRFAGAGQATQRLRFAGEQNWRQGGAFYAGFLPMAKGLAVQIGRRPLRIGAWCKTEGVPAGKEPQLAVSVQCLSRSGPDAQDTAVDGGADATVTFSGGTHGWEHREIRIDPAAYRGTPTWVIISVVSREGTAWFDDVTCVEELGLPNRLPHAGFEGAGADGWPTGWSKPEVWTWWRSPYYLFTGWSHARKTDFRGGAARDPLLSSSGGRSLRMTVYPGDNLAVASAPIALNQDQPRPLEARAMVRADSLRGLELMAQDEQGAWLPQSDFLGDDMDDNAGFYNMGTTGAGTYDWRMVRKYFSPRKPVRSVRLFLCARGFDGAIVEKNRVGTLWWDDVQLLQHGAPGTAAPQAGAAATPFRFRVADLDLGDRLWGKNRLELELSLPDAAAEKQARETRVTIELTGPRSKAAEVPGKLGIRENGRARITAEYRLEDLCRTPEEQYRLTVKLASPGAAQVAVTYPFGTPSRLLTAGASAYYAYPEEPLTLYGQLNVARDSAGELERCEITGAGKSLLAVRDFSALGKPLLAPNYIDTRRLVRAEVRSAGAKVHPWDEPRRDQEARIRLFGRGGALLAESEPLRYGFMQPVPRAAFPPIQRTAVNERGYLTVNGRPYFPVFWTPHFGVAPEASYPPRVFGLKAVDLTEIVYAKNRAPDAEVKAKLLARIAQVKNDPLLFQYELGEGEMQLQGFAWRERAGWLKTAAAWIREADPNHLINGPESWLVGHPDHNNALTAFIPHFDAIGVEASFEEVPKLRQFAMPLMTGRRTAVLVGLETYFYQPLETLRWRGYKALVEGAAGVGLCPSGMLQSRPDRENFLRGLNGEFRGLADVITAPEPKNRIAPDKPVIQTIERVLQGKRYLIAVRNKDTLGPLKVRFAFPPGERFSRVRVRFEDRTLAPTAGGFEDDFPTRMMARVYELEG